MRNVAILLVLVTSTHALAADTTALSPSLQALDISVGKWVFHGENLPGPDQKAGKWTWNEDCGWSANRAFMTCSFVMYWPDGVVKSQVVNTYNSNDKSYWHYEMFDSNGSGADPFISRLTIANNTWTNAGTADQKTYRVTYHYISPTQVSVRIELSSDHVHWTTLAQGLGIKQS
ncbi:MAG: hypothetical protein WA777_21440 [Rhodanobacter sp.]